MGWMSEDSPATLCPSPTIADKLSPMILCPWTPSTGKQATSQWTGRGPLGKLVKLTPSNLRLDRVRMHL